MEVNIFIDETDVATLLLMSTCVQDEMTELESARVAYELSIEFDDIHAAVDSVFTMDITIVLCQMIELQNSLEALDRRIAQLEQARARPEPYRVSGEDQALIRELVMAKADVEVDRVYARKLQEMEDKGQRVGDGLAVEQVFDANTISRMKYQHTQQFEKMPIVFDIPFLKNLKANGGLSSVKVTLGKVVQKNNSQDVTRVSKDGPVPPMRRKPGHQLQSSPFPAQAVFRMDIQTPRPAGVFDLDQTLTKDDVLELTSRQATTKKPFKGKGKAPAVEEDNDDLEQTDITLCDNSSEQLALQLAYSYAASARQKPVECGICFEEFRVTENPFKASISATSSSDRNKGLQLPCRHRYCLGCASQYLKTELDKGPGSEWLISCPECPANDPGRTRFTEEISERILGSQNMEAWYYRDLQEETKGMRCPNPKCSEFVLPPEGPEVQGASTCPSCQEGICLSCETLYHEGYTCEEYQKLPEDERMKEDKLLFDLLEQNGWVRCPQCGVPSEKTMGCLHITCAMCKAHYCYACGGDYNVGSYICNNMCNRWSDQARRAARMIGWKSRSERLYLQEQNPGQVKPDWKRRLVKVFGGR